MFPLGTLALQKRIAGTKLAGGLRLRSLSADAFFRPLREHGCPRGWLSKPRGQKKSGERAAGGCACAVHHSFFYFAAISARRSRRPFKTIFLSSMAWDFSMAGMSFKGYSMPIFSYFTVPMVW